MATYQGKISGIGNATTRKNEITADDLAVLRNYIVGWEYGVINRQGWNFSETHDKDNVTIEKGVMFAYGYFGYLPKPITIPFIKLSATQYRFIYAEIDRSVVPNTFKIKVKNNQGSDLVKPTTFRQDYLTAVKTGVFQLPLWRIKLDNSGIVEVKDFRELREFICKVYYALYTTGKVTKEIRNARVLNNDITDISDRLATTHYTEATIINYINTKLE